MKGFMTVLKYTFWENMRRKTFIISTIILLILTIILMSIPGIINLVNKKDSDSSKGNTPKVTQPKESVFIIDQENMLGRYMPKLSKEFSGYNFINKPSRELSSLKKYVKKHKGTLVVVTNQNNVPSLDYFVRRYGEGINPDDMSKAVKTLFNEALLSDARVDKSASEKILQDISYSINITGKGSFNNSLVAMLIMMMLFFAIYFYGYGVAMSISSEKTSRVMEILLTSTDPSRIILGKSAAMGLLGLSQFFLIIFSGFCTYKLTFPKDFSIGGQKLDFSIFSPSSLILIIIFFILGYAFYSMINAVAGASVSKSEDVNSAMMPCALIMMAAYYVSNITTGMPDGSVSVAASLIPFSSPFAMPSRILMSEVPASQLLLSIGILVATILLTSWVSVKVYSAAVLHYGNRLKIKDLIKITKQQS